MTTAEEVDRLTALLEGPDRTFIVVAPYGSGKSLAASYALHRIENRKESRPALKEIASRLAPVDPRLAEFAEDRRRKWSNKGLAVPLSGPVVELHTSIRDGLIDALRRFGLGREARMNRPGAETGNWDWRLPEWGLDANHPARHRLAHLTWLSRRRPDQRISLYEEERLRAERTGAAPGGVDAAT